MSAQKRDFSSFELGDNVYELADGIVPEIAEQLQVPIGPEPSSADLQEIMKKVGTNKVLRANEPVTAIDRDAMVDMVERSGIQLPLQRSLWTPRHAADGFRRLRGKGAGVRLALGGVANWQDRVANKLEHDYTRIPLHLLGGQRVMDTATEVSNPNVKEVHSKFGRYPTEAEYAASVVLPRLVKNTNVLASSFDTTDGDEILKQFFDKNPQLLEKRISVVRVANAGVVMALQVRAVARTLNPDFDSNPRNPQLFVETDMLPVARTAKEDATPVNYQKAATALRQVVLTAKKLHEAEL
ncbi:hypothetical protein BH09PAT4_BH09PAT4_07820 [soil metagenome]